MRRNQKEGERKEKRGEGSKWHEKEALTKHFLTERFLTERFLTERFLRKRFLPKKFPVTKKEGCVCLC